MLPCAILMNGVMQGCLGTHVRTDALALASLPAAVPFEDAASLPTVFATAHDALAQLAQLKAGERLLVRDRP